MSHIQQVLQICAMLHKKGIKPSTAMVKAKAQTPLPLPSIMTALSKWHAMSDEEKASIGSQATYAREPEPNGKNSLSPEERIDTLEQKIVELEDQIKALQSQVKALAK